MEANLTKVYTERNGQASITFERKESYQNPSKRYTVHTPIWVLIHEPIGEISSHFLFDVLKTGFNWQ